MADGQTTRRASAGRHPAVGRISAWLRDRADDILLRGIFSVLVASTVAVVSLDYLDLVRHDAASAISAPDRPAPSAQPLPTIRRDGSRRSTPPHHLADLGNEMTFDLRANGRLMAAGTITIGTAKRFAAEVEKRGSYIKTVVLHSPGGSVTDALEMGRLIRTHRYATAVERHGYCASSCPLVFAGGVARIAWPDAAIGVHQISAITRDGAPAANDMRDAQEITATVQHYLRDMGVDLEVWLHALETPASGLYYFESDELLRLKLATQSGDTKTAAVP